MANSEPSPAPGSTPDRDFLNSVPKELEELSQWSGNLRDYWQRYSRFAGRLLNASAVLLVVKPAEGDGTWKQLGQWSTEGGSATLRSHFRSQCGAAAEYCLQEGAVCRPLPGGEDESESGFIVAMALPLKSSRDRFVVTGLVEGVSEARAKEVMLRQMLLTELPNQLLVRQQAARASDDVRKISGVLDVVAQVSSEETFIAAAMALCNSVANQHQCERVSLGWVVGDGIRVLAISRTERFDRKMESIQLLEAAMEESLDQQELIGFPSPDEGSPLTRDHHTYQQKENLKFLCSLPLRCQEDVVGVLTCERSAGNFTEAEVQQLQLIGELLSYRLADLKLKDRWVGSRIKDGIRESAARFLGPERTLTKLIALILFVGLLALIVIRVPYRVEANFIVRSEEVYFQAVPFDSYIEEVYKESGDGVQAGEALLKLDTDDLELQESSVLADLNRFRREAEKARAARQLADMRISEALADQNSAQLELIRWRISQATLNSPIDGLLVEGDLKERIGSPVNEGEVLFRIARIDTLFVEAEANERDVDDILESKTGEIAFVSQPKLKFPVDVKRVEPAAVAKSGENVFLVRADFKETPEDWFRPGMSGVCKLDSGKRSLFWIFTHRTVDFFRMLFWW